MKVRLKTGRGGGFSAIEVIEEEDLPVLAEDEFRAEVARRNAGTRVYTVGEAAGCPVGDGVMLRELQGLLVACTHGGCGDPTLQGGFVLDPSVPKMWAHFGAKVFAETEDEAARRLGAGTRGIDRPIRVIPTPRTPDLGGWTPQRESWNTTYVSTSSLGHVVMADGRVIEFGRVDERYIHPATGEVFTLDDVLVGRVCDEARAAIVARVEEAGVTQ